MTKEERRSRKGAWIEIAQVSDFQQRGPRRSRKGAWIEIRTTTGLQQMLESLP